VKLGAYLRHFSIVFNVTTTTAVVRSRFVCREIASNFNKTLKQSNKNFSLSKYNTLYVFSDNLKTNKEGIKFAKLRPSAAYQVISFMVLNLSRLKPKKIC